MADKFMSMRNLKFTLHEVVGTESLPPGSPVNGHSRKSMDMVLDAAFDFAKKALHPIFEEMDRNPPELINGTVAVHKDVRSILATLGKDGWISAIFPEEWGGDNMPPSLLHAVCFVFASANYSASVYSGLTTGAANLIFTFGSEDLHKQFLLPMLEGRWQGTMALTEPEAGTSLGDLTTAATPQADGTYRIKGEKIFISAGDHDGVDNVVHLMLARIDGAPAGVKGISLFAVPKLRKNGKGELVSNDVTVTQVFHKMGYRGAPITALSLGDKDDCTGHLVGEPNRGLSYMFQMMNGARLEVGIGATAIATAAYHASLDYAKNRRQGRRLTDGPGGAPIPIIEHQDVKRMLLFQRAVSEGALSLILQCSRYEDRMHSAPDEEQADCKILLELLTPVAKTFPAEMGILSTSASIQCFGGYGYCEDFPVEQHFRDMRIHAIHEGTTGIQGMDLLGRKVVMNNGKALQLLDREMESTMEKAKGHPELQTMTKALAEARDTLAATTMTLGNVAMEKGPEAFLANATLYLELFGLVTVAWQWLAQMAVASEKLATQTIRKSDRAFYEGKLAVGRYYFSHELPKIGPLSVTLAQPPLSLQTEVACFTD
ncbi:acyl-CoA dehydrogenase [Desulfoluna spongiiphila]|uniref:acyl-CoA dehydrogenase n=1 Tax=Desulfoluna spongiiphila TaxID=419481 RepID=UPI001259CB8B|nr:acyl-CoA dehydrogenase [Desulfoluna spongiiphila]VVS91585.1 acyl-coa dehydrogenase/oxidase c-terminal [Desulfoluna spongiiphila]